MSELERVIIALLMVGMGILPFYAIYSDEKCRRACKRRNAVRQGICQKEPLDPYVLESGYCLTECVCR